MQSPHKPQQLAVPAAAFAELVRLAAAPAEAESAALAAFVAMRFRNQTGRGMGHGAEKEASVSRRLPRQDIIDQVYTYQQSGIKEYHEITYRTICLFVPENIC